MKSNPPQSPKIRTPASRRRGGDVSFRLSQIGEGSFRDQAARALRAKFVTGEMEGGKIYSVPALAARFGVSITPVREAMLDLVTQGLAEPVRNRGFRIIEPTPDDLEEIFELRLLLEVPTLARVAGRLLPADVDYFQALTRRIEEAADRGDLVAFLDDDRSFHLGLLGLLGNGRLVELVDRLRLQSRLPGLEALSGTPDLRITAAEHREILQALVDGERHQVAALMTRHLRHTRGIWAGLRE